MKILTCTSISILAHSLLWLAMEPEIPHFNGGNVADVVALKVKIQQVAMQQRESTLVQNVPLTASNETLFDGKKQQLITVKKSKKAEVLTDQHAVQQTNALPLPQKTQDPIPQKNDKPIEPDLVDPEQPRVAALASDTSEAVSSSAPVVTEQHSMSDELVHVSAPPLFKAPRPLLKYPLRAKRRGQQGVTVVSIELNKQGVIVAVDIVKSSGFAALDKAALNNVKQWQFYAVEQHGHAINAKFTVPVEFSLTS